MFGAGLVGMLLVLATQAAETPLFRRDEVVLFQGDSITDGNRGRSEDPNHILGHGYVFLIASETAATFPEQNLTFINRGISGNTLADLESRWDSDVQSLHPTVLSILVGINDIDQALSKGTTVDLADFERRYDLLLSRTRAKLPAVRLVLCQPFTLASGRASDNERRRTEVLRMAPVIERLSARYKAALVRFQPVFEHATAQTSARHWIWDGIHPTYAGHRLMADAWKSAYREEFVEPTKDPLRNSALNPVVNTERDSYDWLHRHRDILDAQKKADPQVVMIGDSITHFWGGTPSSGQQNGPLSWATYFRNLHVVNMGCGWDRTQNVLWRLAHGQLTGVSPKWVVLNIGTNNLVGDETARTNTPEEVAAGIEEIVRTIHRKCPKTEVLVMGIFPRGDGANNTLDANIRIVNGLVRTSMRSLPRTHFLDLRESLGLESGGARPDLFFDGTHPNEKGYEIWGKALVAQGVLPPLVGK